MRERRGLGVRGEGGGRRVQNHTVSPLHLRSISEGHTAATVTTHDNAARPTARRHRVLLVTSEQSPDGAAENAVGFERHWPKENTSTNPTCKGSEQQSVRKSLHHSFRQSKTRLTRIAPALSRFGSAPCEYFRGGGGPAPARVPSPKPCFVRQSPAIGMENQRYEE